MSRNHLNLAVFAAGLAVVGWIGLGYVVSNPLALAVTLLIGGCYVAGAFELKRYRQATATLAQAVAGLSEPPPRLDPWLDQLDPALRNPVRLRVEGARVALPGPALTPYLVGLLVLLGMLGTLLGMVATLRGTGAALDSATDLLAVREALSAPIKGLGFAFGTSIAGVATSATLGLLSALCRRERLDAAQALDSKIATTLRVHSHAHRRDETLRLLQRQADVMPALVDRLQTMMTALEQQSLLAHERQLASQQAFLGNTEAAYAQLATSVGESLKESAAESARAAGAALQPVMESTMAGIARETAALHGTVEQAVRRQLDGLSAGFDALKPVVESTMAGIARETAALHGTITQAVKQQLDGLSTRFEATAADVSGIWREALSEHRRASDAQAEHLRTSVDRFVDTFERRSAGLVDGVATRLDATAEQVSTAWLQALSQQERINETLADRNRDALEAAAATFEQHAASLLRGVGQSHADLQTELASRDRQRLAAWADTLAATAKTLTDEWEQTGARTASRQQAMCDTLAQTTRDLSAQTHAHARDTIAEMSRLVQAASEAPKAAAEIVAELRQKLSDSMVRDTAMLDERTRLLATLETLLDAVNHASTEQRAAVDALVATSANLLERVGTRFTDHIEAETGKLGAVAAQITGSAVEVASLGDAFGTAVQLFGRSNDTLVDHLQRLEAALDKSLVRSDEQLAYYVAQAREVIDLSLLSQQQIVEGLQQLAGRRGSVGAEAA